MTYLHALEPLLTNENIYEITIDSYHEVFIHTKDGWSKETIFNSKDEYLALINGLQTTFSIKENTYTGYLNEYITFTLVASALSIKGPALRLIKLSKEAYTLDQYLKWKAIDEKAKTILEDLLNSNKGILCAGDFGSGKTTLFNVLINSLPNHKSLVCLENPPGLTIHRERVTRLRAQTQNYNEINEIINTAGLLLGDTIAMSWLDNKWVGPFIDFLRNNARAIAVIGGINPENALERLTNQCVISSDGHNLEQAAKVIAEVFNVIIFQEKIDQDRRVITSINEIQYDKGELKLNKLYSR